MKEISKVRSNNILISTNTSTYRIFFFRTTEELTVAFTGCKVNTPIKVFLHKVIFISSSFTWIWSSKSGQIILSHFSLIQNLFSWTEKTMAGIFHKWRKNLLIIIMQKVYRKVWLGKKKQQTNGLKNLILEKQQISRKICSLYHLKTCCFQLNSVSLLTSWTYRWKISNKKAQKLTHNVINIIQTPNLCKDMDRAVFIIFLQITMN